MRATLSVKRIIGTSMILGKDFTKSKTGMEFLQGE